MASTTASTASPSEPSEALVEQLSFYFTDANLRRDRFMKTYTGTDGTGKMPVETLATFNRVKALTQDVATIIAALRLIPGLQVSEQSDQGQTVQRTRTLPAKDDSEVGPHLLLSIIQVAHLLTYYGSGGAPPYLLWLRSARCTSSRCRQTRATSRSSSSSAAAEGSATSACRACCRRARSRASPSSSSTPCRPPRRPCTRRPPPPRLARHCTCYPSARGRPCSASTSGCCWRARPRPRPRRRRSPPPWRARRRRSPCRPRRTSRRPRSARWCT